MTTPALFSDASNFEQRYVPDYRELGLAVRALKSLGVRVVLTSGSFDIIHEGHAMYLEAARSYGDFLVVGVDSDARVASRKGPGRPVVPETERLRMVAHQRGTGIVTLKESWHAKSQLIATVRPDVLVVTRDTYPADELDALAVYCGDIVVLDRMAVVSTSARLREVMQRLASGGNLEAVNRRSGSDGSGSGSRP